MAFGPTHERCVNDVIEKQIRGPVDRNLFLAWTRAVALYCTNSSTCRRLSWKLSRDPILVIRTMELIPQYIGDLGADEVIPLYERAHEAVGAGSAIDELPNLVARDCSVEGSDVGAIADAVRGLVASEWERNKATHKIIRLIVGTVPPPSSPATEASIDVSTLEEPHSEEEVAGHRRISDLEEEEKRRAISLLSKQLMLLKRMGELETDDHERLAVLKEQLPLIDELGNWISALRDPNERTFCALQLEMLDLGSEPNDTPSGPI